jgi:superfamily II DNA or RNA helicase
VTDPPASPASVPASPAPRAFYAWRHGVSVLVGFEGFEGSPAHAPAPEPEGSRVSEALTRTEGYDPLPPWLSWDARHRAFVAPGHRFPELRRWAEARGIPEATEAEPETPAPFRDPRIPRPYQEEALARWRAQGRRGTVVLPTGAGKSLVALLAIRDEVQAGGGAAVVAPTRALVGQWFSQVADAFGPEAAGAWYGDEKELRRITVTTYHSAFPLLERHGRGFGLLVLDEAHHLADPGGGDRAAPSGAAPPGTPPSDPSLPGTSWHDALRVAPAPARLGLTATYPDGRDRALVQWVGPVAYRRRLGEMLDQELSDLALERRFVHLRPQERARYDEAVARYEGFVEGRGYAARFGPRSRDWWPVFMAETRTDPEARRAHRAFRDRERIVALAEEKLAAARHILGLHPAEQAILFCGTTEAAEAVSARFAIPLVQAATPASERRWILEGMAGGEIRAVAAVEVLDEGWDVPGAKLGIILGGSRSGGPRQHQQRLGRILRKQGDRVASLHELVAADTHEFFQAQRRGGTLRRATDRQLGLGL